MFNDANIHNGATAKPLEKTNKLIENLPSASSGTCTVRNYATLVLLWCGCSIKELHEFYHELCYH